MRRIVNDRVFQKKAKEFSEKLFSMRSGNFIPPATRLAILKGEPRLFNKYKLPTAIIIRYIEEIENNYPKILAANERIMVELIAHFDTILNGRAMTTQFYKAVVEAMRYEALRKVEFPAFIRKTNLKTCCYCHSQSTIVFEKEDGTLKAFFQLDHKYPQSKYPFLATTFYNLYPICGNCNQAKSHNPSEFKLYTMGKNLDLLHFGLENRSIAHYWKTHDPKNLKITITPARGEKKLFDDYVKTFLIKEIYDMQIDIAEDLVHKLRIYNRAYKGTLVKSFKKLFPDQSMINRLIIGNYDKPEEMMQRPTAKFVQEIARDIGLIPKL